MKTIQIIVYLLWFALMVLPVQAKETLTLSTVKNSMISIVGEKVIREALDVMDIDVIIRPYPAKRALVLTCVNQR